LKRLGMHALILGLVALSATTARAQDSGDVVAIIQSAAAQYGADGSQLVRLARCESTLRPGAVGDHGTSLGLFQISTLPTGLMAHFRTVGYSDPLDPWEAASYVARVAVGTWAGQGITLARWSCW
jgi:hypothetical protein